MHRIPRPLGHRLVPLILALAPPALASDGVLEINQTCAVETGCFPGDGPGLPVTIDGSAGRSYRLTGDLEISSINTDGIVISSNDVSVDLNGFAIISGRCAVEQTVFCRPAAGTGSGVTVAAGNTLLGLSVRNGMIVGMGDSGVRLGVQSEVANLRVRWNRDRGISVSTGSIVSSCLARDNGGAGIVATSSVVFDSTARGNGSHGIAAAGTSTASGNLSFDNGGYGIGSGIGSTLTGNTARNNVGDGIDADTASTVSGNSTSSNGGDGIECTADCNVHGNTARSNGDYGLRLTAAGQNSAYRENVVAGNSDGAVLGGIDAGANVIDGALISTP